MINRTLRCMGFWAVAVAWVFSMGCSPGGSRTPDVTFAQLVRGLADRDRLARASTPGAKLVSSFDRRGGNDDYNNPLRDGPEGWVVLADLKGPGYVSRFWFTGAEDGTYPLRFYFDGERKPRLDTTVGDFCGGKEPFLSPLAANEPFCWYSLVPLPYNKSLVIMTKKGGYKEGGWPRVFYHVNYCSFEKGVTVETFPWPMNAEQSSVLADARHALLHPDPAGSEHLITLTNRADAGAGGGMSAVIERGPGVLKEIAFQPDFSACPKASDREAAMRNLTLRMYWDGCAEPSVEVPFGDFFGSFWTARQFGSAYFGMSNGVFYSRFPMPFASSARVEVRNETAYPVPIELILRYEPLAAFSNEWMYFHANWRKTTPAEIGRPHNVLNVKGEGRYAGMILSAVSLDKSWWLLEGDESIRVDDETLPGWLGTGLEDYFNGGWYYGSPIVLPFHGLPFKAHFRTVQYRIHQTDPVNFARSADVRFERGPDNASHGFLESVGFYYLTRPQKADSQLGTLAFREPPNDPVRQATLMLELNDLERLGDFTGAMERLQAFEERYPDFPFLPILSLRRLMAQEYLDGYAGVEEAYTRFAAENADPLAKKYVEDWLWFHASETNALLVTYCNTTAHIFLDGRYVGQSGDPQKIQVFRVNVGPGDHALAIQAALRPYPYWVQAALRTHRGDVVTGPDWRFEIGAKGREWARADFDDSTWTRVGGMDRGKGPPEEPFIWLEPHPFVGLQSRARGIWVNRDWSNPREQTVFRKQFNQSNGKP